MAIWSITGFFLRMFAAALIVVSLHSMVYAAYGPDHPCGSVSVGSHSLDDSQHARLCCEAMHCCPLLPLAVQPEARKGVQAAEFTPVATSGPFFLARPLYPPPKGRNLLPLFVTLT